MTLSPASRKAGLRLGSYYGENEMNLRTNRKLKQVEAAYTLGPKWE